MRHNVVHIVGIVLADDLPLNAATLQLCLVTVHQLLPLLVIVGFHLVDLLRQRRIVARCLLQLVILCGFRSKQALRVCQLLSGGLVLLAAHISTAVQVGKFSLLVLKCIIQRGVLGLAQ